MARCIKQLKTNRTHQVEKTESQGAQFSKGDRAEGGSHVDHTKGGGTGDGRRDTGEGEDASEASERRAYDNTARRVRIGSEVGRQRKRKRRDMQGTHRKALSTIINRCYERWSTHM